MVIWAVSSASSLGNGTGNMRVTRTFFRSWPLAIVLGLDPADVGPVSVSEVNDCASLLLRMLERPNEPSPMYDWDVRGALDSEGKMWTFVPAPL